MICISLSPPYGTLIALALKKIETRGWATSHRGPLGIHQTAAPGPKGTTEAALWDLCLSEPFRAPLREAGYGNPARLPRGKIVAVVELKDCVPTWPAWAQPDWAGEPWFFASYGDQHWNVPPQYEPERSFGDYSAGRHAWLLSDVRALPEPLPARGMPGLWPLSSAAERAVMAQLAQEVAR